MKRDCMQDAPTMHGGISLAITVENSTLRCSGALRCSLAVSAEPLRAMSAPYFVGVPPVSQIYVSEALLERIGTK